MCKVAEINNVSFQSASYPFEPRFWIKWTDCKFAIHLNRDSQVFKLEEINKANLLSNNLVQLSFIIFSSFRKWWPSLVRRWPEVFSSLYDSLLYFSSLWLNATWNRLPSFLRSLIFPIILQLSLEMFHWVNVFRHNFYFHARWYTQFRSRFSYLSLFLLTFSFTPRITAGIAASTI